MSASTLQHASTQIATPVADARLVERVNRLYHERTAGRFDQDHRARHQVEAEFWRRAGALALAAPTSWSRARTIIDVGCGSGFVFQQIAPFLKQHDRAIGIDLSAASLRLADNKTRGLACPARFEWMVASGLALPFTGGCASLVTINAALHHFAEPARLLAELDRLLEPGGSLVLGFEPNAAYFQAERLRHLGATIDRLRWYASARQNWRRLRTVLACSAVEDQARDEHATDECVAEQIASQLVAERLCSDRLTPRAVLDLLDSHARGPRPGLQLEPLLAASLPGYRVRYRVTSDYLGASPRLSPLLRRAADRIGHWIDPDKGSLLSCVLIKPGSRS